MTCFFVTLYMAKLKSMVTEQEPENKIFDQRLAPSWFFAFARVKKLSKSTWGEQPVDGWGYSYFQLYICVYVFVSRLLAKWRMIQTWNLVHTFPSTTSKNGFFCFFKEIPVTAASLEKLPCHVDFPHFTSIALLLYFFNITYFYCIYHVFYLLYHLL